LHSFCQEFERFSNECQLPNAIAQSVIKQRSEYAATHDRSLLQNDTTALSMNSYGKSFHIISTAIFSSAMLVGFGMYLSLIAFQHYALYIIIHWHIHLLHLLLFLRQ